MCGPRLHEMGSISEAHLSGGTMLSRIKTMLHRDEGASAVEYGLLVAGIAAVIVAVVIALGTTVGNTFAGVEDQVDDVAPVTEIGG